VPDVILRYALAAVLALFGVKLTLGVSQFKHRGRELASASQLTSKPEAKPAKIMFVR
jgi:hypothetical protein